MLHQFRMTPQGRKVVSVEEEFSPLSA